MQSSPLDNIHGQSTSGVAYHHGPWSAHTIGCGLKLSPLDNIHRVGQHRARHAIITFEKYTLSHDIERCMMSYPLDYTHVRMTFVVVMPSSPFECTWSDDIDVECHLPIWTTEIVRQRRARHARMAVGQKTWSNNISRGMPSSPLGNRCDQTTSGVAFHHLSCAAHTV